MRTLMIVCAIETAPFEYIITRCTYAVNIYFEKEGDIIRLFSRKKESLPDSAKTVFEMVTETGNAFFCWNGKIFESDLVRACIRPVARSVGKLCPKHIRGDTVNPEPYMRILLEEPNPYMSMQQLLEKMCCQLEINNNAYAVIVRDENYYPVGIYPIAPVNVEADYDAYGEMRLKFLMRNGKSFKFSYGDIIHIRQDFNENDVFGSSLMPVLSPLMEIVTTTDQGIVNAVKNSAVIRWLLKFAQTLRPEDLKKQAKDFAQNYLENTKDNFGVAAVDAKAEAIQVKANDYVPNSQQVQENNKRIYALFGTNEKITASNYNEDEWNAFYELKIEPIAIDLSNEFTRKLFTRKERAFGNKIIFESANLQYASLRTKLALLSMVDRGAMTPNEWRSVLNLAPVEGGDKPVRRLDTAVIKEGEKNEDQY